MEILYKYAEDNNGKIIHIENAMAGVNYFCPECKEKFSFKNGKIRQRHFSHSNPSSNCSGEGYLHKTFKKMLVEKIREHITGNIPLDINWKCNVCNNGHNGNILNGIIDVKAEYDMGVCRPDIALFNQKRNVLIVIEIIDTHEPEETSVKYYAENKITLIQIKIDSLNDLENIENKIKYPSKVFLFENLLCPNYRLYIQNMQLNSQYNITLNNNKMKPRRPDIDQIVAAHERKKYSKNRRRKY